jgi:hypothetical protein
MELGADEEFWGLETPLGVPLNVDELVVETEEAVDDTAVDNGELDNELDVDGLSREV